MFGTIRKVNLLSFIVCGLLIGFSAYLQFYQGLEPCPLCVIQRLSILLLSLVFFAGALYNHTRAWTIRVHSISVMVVAIIGSIAAIRQIWLQHSPMNQLPANCGPDLGYILSNFPLGQALKLVFMGSGECAKVTWSWLGLSIPEWTLLFFLYFIGVAIFQWFRKEFINN